MWADLKGFVADCRCQNNDDVNATIRAYALTVTHEKCNNWINHMKNYVKISNYRLNKSNNNVIFK